MNENKMNPKQIFSRLWLALFIMVFVINAIQIGFIQLLTVFSPVLLTRLALQPWFTPLLIFVSFHVFGFAVFYFMTKNIPVEKKDSPKKLTILQMLIVFLICMATTYLFNYVSIFINYIIGLLKNSPVLNPLGDVVSASNIVYTILVICISAPIVEEFVFRKIMLDRIRPFGDKTAIWVTAIAFGLMHGNLSQFFYAVALGLIFGYIAVRTNTIRYSILLHIFINIFGSVVMPGLLTSNSSILVTLGTILFFFFLISGIILFFTSRKKIYLEDAVEPLERRSRFRIIYLNPGMILYILLCIIMFVSVIFAY